MMPSVNKRSLEEAVTEGASKTDARLHIAFSVSDSTSFETDKDFDFRLTQKGKTKEALVKEACDLVRETVSDNLEVRAITYVKLTFLGLEEDTGRQVIGIAPSWQVPISYFTGKDTPRFHTETAKAMNEISALGTSLGLKGQDLARFVEAGMKVAKPEESPSIALLKELQSSVKIFAQSNKELLSAHSEAIKIAIDAKDKHLNYLVNRNAELESRNRTLEADKKGSLEGTLLAAGDLLQKSGPAGQATVMAMLNAGLDILSPDTKDRANQAFNDCLKPVDAAKEEG